MSIVERITDQLLSDAVDEAYRAGRPVPVSEVADEIILAVGLSPSRLLDLIQRVSAACVAKGLILELKNTKG